MRSFVSNFFSDMLIKARLKDPVPYYQSRLHIAAESDNLKLFECALKHGADPFASGGTTFRYAAFHNATRVFPALIDYAKNNSDVSFPQLKERLHVSYLIALESSNNALLPIIAKHVNVDTIPDLTRSLQRVVKQGGDVKNILTILEHLRHCSAFGVEHDTFRMAIDYENFRLVDAMIRNNVVKKGNAFIDIAFDRAAKAMLENEKMLAGWFPYLTDNFLLYQTFGDTMPTGKSGESVVKNIFGNPESQDGWPDSLTPANLRFLLRRYFDNTGISPIDYLNTCPDHHKAATLALIGDVKEAG